YGSKPMRDLARDASVGASLAARLRSYDDAVAYAPNQAYVGNREPETLRAVPRPWFKTPDPGASSDGAFGDVIDETELLGLLQWNDRARLVQLDGATVMAARTGLLRRGLLTETEMERVAPASDDAIAGSIESGEAIPLWHEGRVAGAIARGHEEDEA